MSRRSSGGRIYSPTCLHIEASLKERAKEAGINMSRALREALEAKLEEIEGAPGQRLPSNPRPTQSAQHNRVVQPTTEDQQQSVSK